MPKPPAPVAPEALDETIAHADYDLARRRVRSIVESPTLDDFLRRVTDYRNRTCPPDTRRVRQVRIADEDKARIGHIFVALLNDPARQARRARPCRRLRISSSSRLAWCDCHQKQLSNRSSTIGT